MKIWAWVACLGLLASVARAQELPTWLRVQPGYVAYEQERTLEDIHRERVVRRRSAWMVATGAGLALGGAVSTAMLGTKGAMCYEPDQRVRHSLPIGLSITGVGLALAVAGAIRMSRVPKAIRPGPYQRTMMGWTAALAGTSALLASWFGNPYWYGCISS